MFYINFQLIGFPETVTFERPRLGITDLQQGLSVDRSGLDREDECISAISTCIVSELNKRGPKALYLKWGTANLLGFKSIYLPPLIKACIHLKCIDFSVNGFESLPAEIGMLTGLERLDLAQNKIEHLPVEMGQLSSLVYINISFNGLKELPEVILRLESLTSLNLIGNPLRDVALPPPSLTKLAWFNDKEVFRG